MLNSRNNFHRNANHKFPLKAIFLFNFSFFFHLDESEKLTKSINKYKIYIINKRIPNINKRYLFFRLISVVIDFAVFCWLRFFRYRRFEIIWHRNLFGGLKENGEFTSKCEQDSKTKEKKWNIGLEYKSTYEIFRSLCRMQQCDEYKLSKAARLVCSQTRRTSKKVLQ